MYINMQDKKDQNAETQGEIAVKIHSGEYKLINKNKRSSVWNVYREIARPDGTKLKWRYYCTGCQRVMQSTGGTTSNLRVHKCHVRYLKLQNAADQEGSDNVLKTQPQQQRRSFSQKQSHPQPVVKKKFVLHSPQYEFLDDKFDSTDNENEIYDNSFENVTISEEEISDRKNSSDLELSNNATRPLFKLLSEDSWSEIPEEQAIEMDSLPLGEQQDFEEETIKPSSTGGQIDASALAEAESYAKAWAHAFLKLNEDQKFYAKRSIDELLVLGRLERLSISTVTSLTTNL